MTQPTQDITRSTLSIIWGALLASHVIYLLVGFLTTGDQVADVAGHEIFIGILGVISLLTFGVTMLLRHRLVKRPVAEAVYDVDVPADLQKLMTRLITIWALAGSIVIYGLVLTFVTFSFAIMVPFFALSVAAMMWSMPSDGLLKRPRSSADLASTNRPL